MSLDLNNIKEQIQTVLQASNTTTGSPIDLSVNLTTRVQQILKTDLERIPIQPSFFPAITCWVDSKTIEADSMARNASNAQRKAEIDVKVAGVIWNSNFATVDEDPADEDIENLMENIEEVLRSNHTLNNAVLWAFPDEVKYFSSGVDEQTHFRIGIMNLKMTVYYRGV